MRGLGIGTVLWHVEVVLRVSELDADTNQQRLLDALAEQIQPLEVEAPPPGRDLTPAWSYDMQPLSPDAGVGVSCWVLADSVGAAADITWGAVDAAVRTLSMDATLWDLRLIPRDAILSSPESGAPLILRPEPASDDEASAP